MQYKKVLIKYLCQGKDKTNQSYRKKSNILISTVTAARYNYILLDKDIVYRNVLYCICLVPLNSVLLKPCLF